MAECRLFLIFRLKQQLVEGPKDGPYQACTRFADVKGLLERHYAGKHLPDRDVSRLVELAFPNSHRERSSCVYGVRQRLRSESSTSATSSSVPFPPSQAIPQDQRRLFLHSTVQLLQSRNEELGTRLAQLEADNQALKHSLVARTNTVSVFEDEVQKLSTSPLFIHGPDSSELLEEYSLDAVMAEVELHAPHLTLLFNNLGDTHRGGSEGTFNTQQMKALSALCTLLNARNRKISGFQLFTSMMLVGRGTSKQV